ARLLHARHRARHGPHRRAGRQAPRHGDRTSGGRRGGRRRPRPSPRRRGLPGPREAREGGHVTVNPTTQFGQFHGADPEVARFFWTGGPVEVAERTWFASLLSGVTAFDTDDGVVVVDTGTTAFGANLAATLRQRTAAPVHTAVY